MGLNFWSTALWVELHVKRMGAERYSMAVDSFVGEVLAANEG
jgi:hypothetical protein